MKEKTKNRPSRSRMSRRSFLAKAGVLAGAVTIVPRAVLGGAGHVAPSEKIAFAYIGCGTGTI